MKYSSLVGAAALSLLMSSAALAQPDCHQDMKDMLQGTLDMANQTDVRTADDDGSNGCTVADWRGEPSPLNATSRAPSNNLFFLPSA